MITLSSGLRTSKECSVFVPAPIPLNVKASPLCAAVGRPAIEKKLLFSLIANTSAGILSVETPPRTTLEDTMSILPVP